MGLIPINTEKPDEKKEQPTSKGLIQEVAIGNTLSEQLLKENQIKKG